MLDLGGIFNADDDAEKTAKSRADEERARLQRRPSPGVTSPWGKVLRIVRVEADVWSVDAEDCSGYWVGQAHRGQVPEIARTDSAENRNGWYREGRDAGHIVGVWPGATVETLTRADNMSWAEATTQLRRWLEQATRWLEEREVAADTIAAVTQRFENATIEVEELPDGVEPADEPNTVRDVERGDAPVRSERGLDGARGARDSGVGGEPAQVGASDAGRSEGPGGSDVPPQRTAAPVVDAPEVGAAGIPGDIFDDAGSLVGSSAHRGGRTADDNHGREVPEGPGGRSEGADGGEGDRRRGGPESDDATSAGGIRRDARGGRSDRPSIAESGDSDGGLSNAVPGSDLEDSRGPALMSAADVSDGAEYRSSELAVPSGAKARFRANLAAVELVHELEREQRAATSEEQRVLAAWSGWGALPHVFENREGWHEEHERLREVLTPDEYRAAERNTLNAHYTDPKIADAMWRSLTRFGLGAGASVLEPGCGSGTFMATAPEDTRMIGVELDPFTARVAHYLHPKHQVRNEGFENTLLPKNGVDAAIGNVPFGKFTLLDSKHNPQRLTIHNHFIVKSLAATRPSGLVAVITSGFTMDAGGSKARTEMAKLGKLVAGVRLPTEAFKDVAGTSVNTDILVFQRHDEDVAVPDMAKLSWAGTEELTEGVAVNKFFAQHPERVLGEMATRSGQFGPTLVVKDESGTPLAERVEEQLLFQLRANASPVRERDTNLAIAASDVEAGLYVPVPEEHRPVMGMFVDVRKLSQVDESVGRIVRWTGTEWEDAGVRKNAVKETLALMEVRDAARSVVESQSDTTSTENEREQARHILNVAYDRYTAQYGPINRFTQSTRKPTERAINKHIKKRTDEWQASLKQSGYSAADVKEMEPSSAQLDEWREEAITDLTDVRKTQKHLAALGTDPFLGQLIGLENFDEETQSATKSMIFIQDIVSARLEDRRAETMQDAVAISMDEYQRVDLSRIGQLLDLSEEEVREQIIGTAFVDPSTGELEVATHYLSGNVRDKLAKAQAAAKRDSRFNANVDALEAVLPEWIAIEDIDLYPGLSVLDEHAYERFATETFGGVELKIELTPESGEWKVTAPARKAFGDSVLHQYGTEHRKPSDLLESVMNQRSVIIRTTRDSDKPKVDEQETALARAKMDSIVQAFSKWVLDQPQLRERIEHEWNYRFNQYVSADYGRLGDALALPGLSDEFVPHPYQREAVARIVNEPTTLLNHVVGAGKTGTMLMGAMELRRTGQARKPWLVVPNHLVEQVTREATQWYPNAKVMSIPTGQSPKERQMWMTRSAGQDWDLVVCPQSVFTLMGVDPSRQANWMNTKIEEMRETTSTIDTGTTNGKRLVKRLNADIANLETKLKRVMEKKDRGLTFEQTGCDFLMVDEAHHYKNLARASDVADLAHSGSQKAADLEMKLEVLREFREDVAQRDGTWHEDYVPHVAVFATGTPVANSLSEMWVMQRYLRPDLLKAQGTSSLREWGRAFARSASQLEPTAGGTWKMKDRVRSFVNVPELMSTAQAFMSTVTREDITATLPNITGGEPTIITRDLSDQAREKIEELASRSNNLPTDQSLDNMLKINNEGKLLSIDPRLVGLDADEDGGRLADVAEQIMHIHEETKDREYTDANGEVEPVRGGLQIVFCDRGVPDGSGAVNLYEVLKENLVERGLDPDSVAFIHDADNDAARGELFERCRSGQVNVLIGSTDKMGTGVNVQKRATAIHHVDVPWRPADLEQRNGRVFRQGNQNTDVTECRYVTIESFDQLLWQTIHRKAKFISQIMNGDAASRTVEQEDDEVTLSAGAIAAIASGDPMVMRREEVMRELEQLEALEKAYRSQSLRERSQVRSLRAGIERSQNVIADREKIRPLIREELGYVNARGESFETAGEAKAAITDTLLDNRQMLLEGGSVDLGRLDGLKIHVRGGVNRWFVEATDAPTVMCDFEPKIDRISKTDVVQRMRNVFKNIDNTIAKNQNSITHSENRIEDIEAHLASSSFEQRERLDALKNELADIDKHLGLDSDVDETVIEDWLVYANELMEVRPDTTKNYEMTARNAKKGDLLLFEKSSGPLIVKDPEAEDAEDVLMREDGTSSGLEWFVRPFHTGKLIARQFSQLTEWQQRAAKRDAHAAIRRDFQAIEPGSNVVLNVDGACVEARTITRKSGQIESGIDFEITGPNERINEHILLSGTWQNPTMILQPEAYTEEDLRGRARVRNKLTHNELMSGETVTAMYHADTGEKLPLKAPFDENYSENGYGFRFVRSIQQVLEEMGRQELHPSDLVFDTASPRYAGEAITADIVGEVKVGRLMQGDRVRLSDLTDGTPSDECVTVQEVDPNNLITKYNVRYRTDDGQRATASVPEPRMIPVVNRWDRSFGASERLRSVYGSVEEAGVNTEFDTGNREVRSVIAFTRSGKPKIATCRPMAGGQHGFEFEYESGEAESYFTGRSYKQVWEVTERANITELQWVLRNDTPVGTRGESDLEKKSGSPLPGVPGHDVPDPGMEGPRNGLTM